MRIVATLVLVDVLLSLPEQPANAVDTIRIRIDQRKVFFDFIIMTPPKLNGSAFLNKNLILRKPIKHSMIIRELKSQ
jgi:hypothetical protein